MTPELIQEFQGKYQSLSGHVEVAADIRGAVDIVAGLIKQYDAKTVALAKLPGDVQGVIQQHCKEVGVECLVPPYPGTEMPAIIDRAQVGISGADFAIAETGSFVEFALNDASRLVSALPRVHIAFVWAQDIVGTLREAAPLVRAQFENNSTNCVVSFVSGPSRSGDIEMKLTLGVHGPEQSYVIVLTDKRPGELGDQSQNGAQAHG